MDSITVDVTDLDQNSLRADQASLIHDAYPIEAMAADLGTISYEIMTTLGQRADWHYHGG
jgi:alanine racemase